MTAEITLSSRLTPTPHQEAAIAKLVSNPSRAALMGAMLGSGKTLVSTEFLKRTGTSLNLVTAPLHTKDGWIRHFDSQGLGEIRVVDNKSKSGRNAFADLKFGVSGNYFMGRELARLQDWKDIPLDAWVSDESHSWCSPKSRGFKSAKTMTAEYKVAQSATWFGSSFEGAWAPARILWPDKDSYGEIADRSFYRWQDYFCRTEYDPFAPMNKKVVGEKNPGFFVNQLPCYVFMDSDLPDLEPIEIRYELSPTQRKLYKQMEEQSLVWLGENPLAAELPVTQRMRLREITLAEPSLDEHGAVTFLPGAKSSLYDTMYELLGDLLGEQVLMGTHSAKFARYVADRLGNAFAWTGDKTDQQKEDAKRDFIAGNIQHLVATQKGASEGIDGFQLASHVLFELSLDESPVLQQQFVGRLNRRGQTKHVIPYRFIATGTNDDPVHESLLSKELAMRASLR